MKRSSLIPALLFLAGIMCLLVCSCTDEEKERGTMVPLRLSMSIPAASGSVSTRATTNMGTFKMALSTDADYATKAKNYLASSGNTASSATLAPTTTDDELKISRLDQSTPLTLYGTFNHPDLGAQPMVYSGTATVSDGAISITPQLANAVIFVNVNNGKTYKVFLSYNAVQVPQQTSQEYLWDTSSTKPSLKAYEGNNYKFLTSTITSTSEIASNKDKGYFIVPTTVKKGNMLMNIYEWDGVKEGASYTVNAPSNITFEANKCYFITLKVYENKEVSMTINIEPLEEVTVEARIPGIYNQKDLKDFRDAWNSNSGSSGIASGTYAKWMDKSNTVNLYADIDLNNEEWTWIKTWQNVTFNGNNHTLSNLSQTLGTAFGLFEGIDNATVKNLTIQGATVSYQNTLSSVITIMLYNNGKISNCHIKNANLTGAYSSGFVCNFLEGKIEGCSISNSSITGTQFAAGIAAYSANYPEKVEITACTVSDCSIDGEAENSGIIGTQTPGLGATITTCTVSDVQLVKTKKYHAIADEASNIIKDCSYTNVWADGVLITTK